MSLSDELLELKDQGTATATSLWEKLAVIQPPFNPVNLFKAVCTIKSAELLTRLSQSGGSDLQEFLDAIGAFVESTLEVAGGATAGDQEGGMTAVKTLEALFPISKADFEDPARFAIRQHALDALLFKAASDFNKESETKAAVQTLQMEFMRIVISGMTHDLVGEKPIGNAGNA
jgi:hypothetical protein